MSKLRTKIGDVFSVQINDDDKKYFQLIAIDSLQLNSDVIRVFRKTYDSSTKYDLEEIVNDDVEFHAHCVASWGLKLGLWQKEGYVQHKKSCEARFRNTPDYGSTPGKQLNKTRRWYIWKLGADAFEKPEKFDANISKYDIGIIINPQSIVHRMKFGRYDFSYPDIELTNEKNFRD